MDLKSFAAIVMKHVRDYVQPAIEELTRRIDSIPAGKDGANGKDGRDGVDGKDGKDGAPGRDGIDGGKGENGADGKDGRDGVDGKSVTIEECEATFRKFYESTQAVWALDFERRATDLISRRLESIEKPKDGKDGKDGANGLDGKDGADGMGFDDLSVEYDGERSLTFVLSQGERRKEFKFKMPVLIDRGVHERAVEYTRGDGVTCNGNYWICQAEATTALPGASEDWRLAVRRGRDKS